MIGFDRVTPVEELRRRLETGPADLAPLRELLSAGLRPAEPFDDPWTDDHAPVEWVTDRMIVEFAAEGGDLDEDYLPTRPE